MSGARRCLGEHPGLEPAARSQARALGQRGCWQPERSGSRLRSGKLAFTSLGCPPGCFGEEQKKNASWNTAHVRGRQLAELVSGVPWALEGKDRGSGRAAQRGKNTALETDVNEDVGGEMVKGEAGRWLQGEKQREPLPGRSGDSQEARCTSKEHWGMKAERRQEAVGG